MKIEISKEQLADMVKGTSPYYYVFDHPLVKKSGRYIGGFHDKWEWNYGFHNDLTKEELWELYNVCKNSWKE